MKFNNKKGITLASLTIYVVVATLIVGILAFLNAQFFSNIAELTNESRIVSEKLDLKTSIIKDLKSSDEVTITEFNSNSFRLSNNTKYEIRKNDELNTYAVFRNDVKICDGIYPTIIEGRESPYFDYDSEKKILKLGLQYKENSEVVGNSIYRDTTSFLVGRAASADSGILYPGSSTAQYEAIVYDFTDQKFTQVKNVNQSVNLYTEANISVTPPVGKYLAGWNSGRNPYVVEYALGALYEGSNIVLYPVWKEHKKAVYLPGKDFNKKIKALAGDRNNTFETVDTNIKAFEWSSTEPANANKTADNIVSTNYPAGTEDEFFPIYAWYENNTIKLWSEASDITFNNDASYMLYNLRELSMLKLLPNFFVTSTENVTNTSYMFAGCNKLISIDFQFFKTDNVVLMESMFEDCKRLGFIDVSEFNVSNVTNFSKMFSGCEVLVDLDVTEFNTYSATNMSGMFKNCSTIKLLNPSGFNVHRVETMESMFEGCNQLPALDLSSYSTDRLTNMKAMFKNCFMLSTLNLSSFTTNDVTDMSELFYKCNRLASINLADFNTLKVTDFSKMFAECTNLSNLNVSNFNTSSATKMNSMFSKCEKISRLNVSNFDMSLVEDLEGMFAECYQLTELNLGTITLGRATSTKNLFMGCRLLPELDIRSFDTRNITDMTSMFQGCSKLKKVQADPSKFTTARVTASDNMFLNCTEITGSKGTTYNSNRIKDEYAHVDGGTVNPGYFTGEDDRVLAEIAEVGDYIEYIPNASQYRIDTNVSGYSATQRISTDTTTPWRIWKITSSKVLITPASAVNTTGVSGGLDGKLAFKGHLGYVNGAALIDKACKTLYTCSSLRVNANSVRSMTSADIDEVSTYNKEDAGTDTFNYGDEHTFDVGTFYLPIAVGGGHNSNPARLATPFKLKYNFYTGNRYNSCTEQVNNSKLPNMTYIDLLGGSAWLASNGVELDEDNGDYFAKGYLHVLDEGILQGQFIYDQTGYEEAASSYGLQPVVSLDKTIIIDETDDTRDGTSPSKAWKVTLP